MLQLKKNKLTAALALAGLLAGSSPAFAGAFIFRAAVPGLRASIALGISPASFDFGAVKVGSSLPQTFTVVNTGSAAATGLQYQVPGGFSVSGSCGTSLSAGGQCSEIVTFSPTAAQAYAGEFVVTNGTQSAAVGVTGSGTSTSDSLSTSTLNFGSVALGATSAAQAVLLTNTGNTALAISQISASGDFAATQNCGSSLAVGGNCSINVTFTPQTAAAESGNLSIVSGAGTHNVTLTGTGLQASLAVSPASLAFGNVYSGETSASKSFSITNTGNTAATSLAVAVPAGFTQTSTCGTSLATGATCTVNVSFSPTSVKSYSGNVTVSSSANTATVAVTGTGSAFSFNLTESSPGTLDVRTAALAAGWDGTALVQANVASGVILGSSSTGAYALTIQGSFPGGVQLVNNGTISGAGGAGGKQGTGVSPTAGAGGAGGPALYAAVAVTVTNNGVIAGGGGGGGGGGTGSTWMGGAGGGGQGYAGGAAGPTGDYVGNAGTSSQGGAGEPTKGSSAGGAGGTAGVAGGTGVTGSSANGGGGGGGGGWGASGGTGGNSLDAPAAGGAGGSSVVGNAYITWTATGTRYGAVQ